MTNKIDVPIDAVKYLRSTMAAVSKRFGKAAAVQMVNEIIGIDPMTGEIARPGDLTQTEAMERADKLQKLLDGEATTNVVEFPTPRKEPQPQVTLLPQDINGIGNLNLTPLDVLYQQDRPPSSLPEVCQRWVWCTTMKRYIKRTDPTIKLDAFSFDSMFNRFTELASAHKHLTKTAHMQRFMFSDFKPGGNEFEGERYNVWRPSPIVPKHGDTKLWNDHIEWLIADETERNHFLDWLAWVLQNPSKQPGYGLLLVGEQVGTGKSFVARVMEQIVGEVNTQRPKNSSLKGDFNPWIAMCRLCLIEELNQIGKREVAHELRDLITEPTVEVNPKGINPYIIPNHAAIMGISNYPDALPIDPGDRRWQIITSKITEEEKFAAVANGHFRRIMPIVEPGNPNIEALAAIAFELMGRDVRHFRQGDAPMTAGKQEAIDLSRTPLESWLNENIDNDPFTRHVVNFRDDVIEAIPLSVRADKSVTRVEATVRKFCKSKLGAVKLGTFRVKDGKGSKVVQLWAMNSPGITGENVGDVVSIYQRERGRANRAADAETVADFGEE